jgi:hypothetical protein
MSGPEPPAQPTDPLALVQQVLRESYVQTNEDLRYFAEKVRASNDRKRGVRAYLHALREFRVALCREAGDRGIAVRQPDKEDLARLAEVFADLTRSHAAPDVACETSIPDRVPPEGITDLEQLEQEIGAWEEKLNSLGDDAQLANVDLQNLLQKQQQTLQMMSNISKMLHDTAMSVIRKIGG